MERVGTALARIADGARVTDLPARSVERPRSLRPTTLDEAKAISAWAEATMPVAEPASLLQITTRLEHLDAMFPRQQQSDKSGEMRTAGYLALLVDYSDDALRFMVRECSRRFNWFPTIKQCLDILAEYREPQSEQAVALIECRRFAADAFDQWIVNVRDAQEIGDVPEQWLRIAVERGILRMLEDGSHVIRARYHGPLFPVSRT